MHSNIRLVISFAIACVGCLATALLALPAAAGTNSWVAIGPDGANNSSGGPFAVDPSSPSTIYSVANGNTVTKTTDGGGHWADLAIFALYGVNSLVIDRASPATIYVAGGGPWDYGDFPIYKSIDGGAHWAAESNDRPTSLLAIAPSLSSTLYAGENEAVLKSIDGGLSWAMRSNGLTGFYVSALAIDPTNADAVYVAQQVASPIGGPDTGKIFKSTDGAGQWRQVPISAPAGAVIMSLAIDPATPSIVYAAYAYSKAGNGGVFKSIDSGETWIAAQNGLSDTNGVMALAIDPSAPARIYAATQNGVFMSTDAAASWTPINSGLTTLNVGAISIDRTGSILRTVSSAGLFEYRFSGSSPAPQGTNFGGLWWNSPAGSEAGWGLNFAHQGDVIFVTWFTYDLGGNPWWLTMTAAKTAEGTYGGTIFETNGPAFNDVPFNPAFVTATAVGTGTLTFSDANNGSFAYIVNGVAQVKAITRQVFGPVPTCTFGAQSDLTLATNYQDLWWAAPAGVESGWGVNFTHQGDIIFATWFTYFYFGWDYGATPLWLSATANRTAPGVYAGTLYYTTGPAFNAVPFRPANVTRTAVGTLTITFAHGNSANFAYTVDSAASTGPGSAVTQSKPIVRQVFRTPGTVCQ